MIKSGRSKRRKTRLEINLLGKIYSNHKLKKCDSNTSKEILLEKNITIAPENNNFMVDNDIGFSSEAPLVCSSAVVTPIEFSSISCTDLTVNCSPEIPISDFLSGWAVKYNISHNAVNGLLKGLKTHKCFNYLPVDSRTLIQIPHNTSKEIRTVEPGIYHHFGLANGILKHAPPNIDNIRVVLGIDGLPLSKSGNNQFWPILAFNLVEPPLAKVVYLVGLYYGKEKPYNSNNYLLDFVKEAKDLTLNGILINNIKVHVSIHVLCCDAPAKSFVLKVKGHSGFSSCTRCKIEGEHIKFRVCFPYTQIKPIMRSHQDYINLADEDYHVGNEISNLAELPNFNSVSSFSLDYMHLVCLGVMKKLLMLWVSKGPVNVRIRSSKINELSSSLLNINVGITSDFVRKCRSMQELSRWKATEFRLFLLYIGPIVLKNIINEECYTNFMTLNISIIILLNSNYSFLLNYARQLLDFFVMSFQNIYGTQFVSHNVHGLLHLCDDYELYGPLHNYSAFIFENYMKELKSFVKKHEKPLQQVMNRYNEKCYANTLNINNSSMNNQKFIQKPELKHMHANGPLVKNVAGSQYYTLLFKNIIL